jgi:hypothetical protein
MRRPKRPGEKEGPPEREILGGRAFGRVQQDALRRGVTLEPPPAAEDAAAERQAEGGKKVGKKKGKRTP